MAKKNRLEKGNIVENKKEKKPMQAATDQRQRK
jgi:hypothetical protein